MPDSPKLALFCASALVLLAVPRPAVLSIVAQSRGRHGVWGGSSARALGVATAVAGTARGQR